MQTSRLPLADSGRGETANHVHARHCLGWLPGAEPAPTDLLLSSGRLPSGVGQLWKRAAVGKGARERGGLRLASEWQPEEVEDCGLQAGDGRAAWGSAHGRGAEEGANCRSQAAFQTGDAGNQALCVTIDWLKAGAVGCADLLPLLMLGESPPCQGKVCHGRYEYAHRADRCSQLTWEDMRQGTLEGSALHN